MANNKWYVGQCIPDGEVNLVAKVFDNWDDTRIFINKKKNGNSKSFSTKEEAESFAEKINNGSIDNITIPSKTSDVSSIADSDNNTIPGTDLPMNETEEEFYKRSRQFYLTHKDYYIAFSDGGTTNNGKGGSGGSGFVVLSPEINDKRKIFAEGYDAVSMGATNNTTELRGAIDALNAIPKGAKAALLADSSYVYFFVGADLASSNKIPRLEKKGKHYKNEELVKELNEAVKRLEFTTVPRQICNGNLVTIAHGSSSRDNNGKCKFPYNKICDKLAEYAKNLNQDSDGPQYLIKNEQELSSQALYVRDIDENQHGIPVKSDGSIADIN